MVKQSRPAVLRSLAEQRHTEELTALAKSDEGPRPPGWQLSPRAVRTFVCGGDADGIPIARKFFGDDALVERAIVTLAGSRGLLLVGEPGTAKSMLSELLTAAICGDSTIVVQGSAATTEDQILFSWNYALLLAEGPSERALVAGPFHRAMSRGALVRFEEITRCPPEVQDTLVGILSEKLLAIPELEGAAGTLQAMPGFNVIATANLRDRGVHEMSAALKRRFHFETVRPLDDLDAEVELVRREAGALLTSHGADTDLDPDVVAVLVEAFQDLRSGRTRDGRPVDRPSTVVSTAEAVSVCLAAGLDARYFGDGGVRIDALARHLAGAVFQDRADDLVKLRHYLHTVAAARAGRGKRGKLWKELHAARRHLPG